MTRVGTRGPVLSGKPVPVGPPWWNPNGDIVCANIWAYRAVNTPGTPWPGGPTNYAETLVNLVNPGVNDLVEVPPGAIPWNVLAGWQFVAGNTQCFDTGVVPTLNPVTWSALVQYANLGVLGTNTLFGMYNAIVANALLVQESATPAMRAYNSFWVDNPPALLAGNYGIAGKAPYRNGLPEPLLIPAGVGVAGGLSIYIGALNFNGAAVQWATADIASLCLYDCTIVPAQFLAVATAMTQL